MSIVKGTVKNVDDRVKVCGEEYRKAIMSAVVSQEGDTLSFDTTHPGWGEAVKIGRANAGLIPEKASLISRAASMVKTVAKQNRVSQEIAEKRVAICESCPYSEKVSEEKPMRCTLCGCGLTKKLGVFNLASYAEDLPKSGCKHPKGSRWKEAGL